MTHSTTASSSGFPLIQNIKRDPFEQSVDNQLAAQHLDHDPRQFRFGKYMEVRARSGA